MSLLARVGTVVVLAVAGCGQASPGAGGGSPTPTAPGPSTPAPAAATTAPAPATGAPPGTPTPDPWLLTTAGIGPYRLGARVDSMPAGSIVGLTAIDSTNCPELYSAEATGRYAGALLFVVRHNVLVEIGSAGGSPGVHSARGDRVGDSWSIVEGRYPTGVWRTNPSGERAFFVPSGDRVMMFGRNPIRPASVGILAVGLTDHTQQTFITGRHC